MSVRFWAWYNQHIAAGWYKSVSLYVGMLAALFPYALGIIEAAVAQWPDVAVALRLTPMQTTVIQILLATVVLPAARAWQQKNIRVDTLKQAAKSGDISSATDTDALLITVADKPPVMVRSSDTKNDTTGA